ncbi:MAG: hypothetical protein K940chlam8_00923 [Chlamydiae bacterium]|nr:hypothetical protein [Chlamydiota bacterium]
MKGVFLDSETNGLNPNKHAMVELAFKIVDLTNGEELFEYERIIKLSKSLWEKSDERSLKINGHTRELNNQGREKMQVRDEVIGIFKEFEIVKQKAVFICQNPSFDRCFFSQIIEPETQEALNFPYHWLDLASMFFVTQMQKGKEDANMLPWNLGLSKDQIAKAYGLPEEKKPHHAMQGVEHLIQCFEKVINLHHELKCR